MSKNSQDDLIRIRENQRRSRNRRKELIQDLQNRVHQFELKGVAATQEMQRAARKVAVENGRLRDLLGQHGVSKEEIESYLRSCEVEEKEADGTLALERNGTVKVVGEKPVCSSARRSSPVEYGLIDTQQLPALDPRSRPHKDKDPRIPKPTKPDATDLYTTLYADSHIDHPHINTHLNLPMPPKHCNLAPTVDITEDTSCPNTADCFCPPTLPASNPPPSSTLEISCETAATIIAQMRGDGDQDAARASLGCRQGEDCRVKSSTIMQLMDER